jgi:hypothetical protein
VRDTRTHLAGTITEGKKIFRDPFPFRIERG